MKNKSERKRLDSNSFLLAVAIILFFVMYIAGIIMLDDRGFTKVQSLLNLFISNADLIVVATGMTIVMITGDIDISVSSVVAMVCMMLAWTMGGGNIGAFPAILIVLVTRCIFGLIQGFLVAYLKIQPFIITLASMFFARGMTSTISQEMISITNRTLTDIATFKMHLPFSSYLNKKEAMIYPYVYPSIVIALVVLAIMFVVFRYAKLGRSIYTIGGNEQSVLLLGLSVRRIKLQAYVLDRSLAGLNDLLFCMNTRSGFMEQVKGFEMDAIASSVIDETLLIDGVGNIIGSLFGALIKETIKSFITFRRVLSSWWVRITITALLCFFIVLQSLIATLKREGK